ncbi:hypothetical protein B0H13DRAFT_437360 [Mycena leptocephala]|nr:hypothetical protein B0H13DRAFT_437360 [Mycena leptocephala]
MRNAGHTGGLGASSRAPMASSFRISHAVSPDGANADIAPARRTRSWKSTPLCARSRPFTPVRAQGWERADHLWCTGADVARVRISLAHLGAPLRIVRLSSPGSTRPIEGLRHSSTSRIVGGSSNTHKQREIEGWCSPLVHSCTDVSARRPSIVHHVPPTWRASLSAKPCVAAPPKCARPHTLAQTLANRQRLRAPHA